MQDDFSYGRMFFDAVREVAGEDGIATLQRTFLGSELHVPGNRVTEGSAFARAIGLDAARQVVDKLRVIGADDRPAAGFRVYIGQGPFSIRLQARAAALDALAAGMMHHEVARHVGIAARTVAKIVQRYRDETGQADAFPLCHVQHARDRDADVIAAHAEGPTVAEMAARLGIGPARLHDRLRSARARTGLALALRRPERLPRPAKPPRPCQLDAASWAERKGKLIAAHAEGMTPGAIAQRFGWTVGYVYTQYWRVRQETGSPLLFSRAPGQDKLWGDHIRTRQAQVEAAFDEGLSVQKIADRLKVSVSTVKNYLAKLRRTTGRPFTFDGPRDHPHTRMGEDRRRMVATVYAPGITLDALAGRTGLTERAVQGHLARLRRDTGAPFALTRRPHAGAGCASP